MLEFEKLVVAALVKGASRISFHNGTFTGYDYQGNVVYHIMEIPGDRKTSIWDSTRKWWLERSFKMHDYNDLPKELYEHNLKKDTSDLFSYSGTDFPDVPDELKKVIIVSRIITGPVVNGDICVDIDLKRSLWWHQVIWKDGNSILSVTTWENDHQTPEWFLSTLDKPIILLTGAKDDTEYIRDLILSTSCSSAVAKPFRRSVLISNVRSRKPQWSGLTVINPENHDGPWLKEIISGFNPDVISANYDYHEDLINDIIYMIMLKDGAPRFMLTTSKYDTPNMSVRLLSSGELGHKITSLHVTSEVIDGDDRKTITVTKSKEDKDDRE